MPAKELSNREIIEFIKKHFDQKNDSAAARLLDIDRQSIHGFGSKDKIDINNKIISLLIDHIQQLKPNFPTFH